MSFNLAKPGRTCRPLTQSSRADELPRYKPGSLRIANKKKKPNLKPKLSSNPNPNPNPNLDQYQVLTRMIEIVLKRFTI